MGVEKHYIKQGLRELYCLKRGSLLGIVAKRYCPTVEVGGTLQEDFNLFGVPLVEVYPLAGRTRTKNTARPPKRKTKKVSSWGLRRWEGEQKKNENADFPQLPRAKAKKKERETMNERGLKEFQQILNYFPLTGISIAELAKVINVSMSCLYDFRNGLRPKEKKYLYIMEQLKEKFPKELKKIGLYIQIDRELEQEELQQEIEVK